MTFPSGRFADPNQAAFLQQLIDNPSLRQELETDPVATLGRFGIEMDPDTVPEQVQLPSEATIRSALACDGEARLAPRWVPFLS